MSVSGSTVGHPPAGGPPRVARLLRRLAACWAGALLFLGGVAQEFDLDLSPPTLDRWMYPFGFDGGSRPVAPTFASFDPRFDTADAQFLLGWDTGGVLRTNAGPRNYLLRRVRVRATIARDQAFHYDPTFDTYLTYLTNAPGHVPDADLGRPVELYGVGFRNGFTAETFGENTFFGPVGSTTADTISIGTRNAFAAMFDEDGGLLDIANHVGQTNAGWTNAPYEARPWAVGTTDATQPGELVPEGAVFHFDLDLSDPLVVAYLQTALDAGRLRLMLSSLSPASQVTPGGTGGGGSGAYPQWATRENLLFDPPGLEIEGTVVSDTDSDTDGLPDDWERHHFASLDPKPGDDPDHDGRDNRAEWLAGTDPRRAADVLAIVDRSAPGEPLRLRFPIAPGRTYRVEASPDLDGWEPLDGTLRFPEPGIGEWTADEGLSPDGPAWFLRVRAD